MANELSLIVNLDFSKGGATVSRQYTKKVTVAGDAYTSGIQAIGFAAEEEIAQGLELATPGYMLIKNLDTTNYVRIGSTTGVYDIRINAGEFALYRHNSATVYAIADTGICNVEYTLLEA